MANNVVRSISYICIFGMSVISVIALRTIAVIMFNKLTGRIISYMPLRINLYECTSVT